MSVNSREIKITFKWKDATYNRVISWMYISYYQVKEFYRIPGKQYNFDVYKKDGVWVNMNNGGIEHNLLQIVGAAIDQSEKNGTIPESRKAMF